MDIEDVTIGGTLIVGMSMKEMFEDTLKGRGLRTGIANGRGVLEADGRLNNVDSSRGMGGLLVDTGKEEWLVRIIDGSGLGVVFGGQNDENTVMGGGLFVHVVREGLVDADGGEVVDTEGSGLSKSDMGSITGRRLLVDIIKGEEVVIL